MKVFSINERGPLKPNLWCACADYLDLVVLANSNQYISFSIMVDGHQIGLSVIYASTCYLKGRSLWQELNSVQ